MHYSNIATVALEQCIETPPARAAGGSQFIEYKQRAPYASLTVNYLQNYLRLYFSLIFQDFQIFACLTLQMIYTSTIHTLQLIT